MFLRSTFATAAVLAAAALSSRAQMICTRNYTVVPGDTCDGISAKASVSTFQLANVNRNTINAGCTNLFVGEVLCLGILGQDCEIVHVVAEGDNCEVIAQAAGTTTDILLANNPNVDSQCTNIYPGEVLCTADVVVAPSATATVVATPVLFTPILGSPAA